MVASIGSSSRDRRSAAAAVAEAIVHRTGCRSRQPGSVSVMRSARVVDGRPVLRVQKDQDSVVCSLKRLVIAANLTGLVIGDDMNQTPYCAVDALL